MEREKSRSGKKANEIQVYLHHKTNPKHEEPNRMEQYISNKINEIIKFLPSAQGYECEKEEEK